MPATASAPRLERTSPRPARGAGSPIVLGLAAIVLGTLLGAARAAEGNAVIEGLVKDGGGVPMPGVMLMVTETRDAWQRKAVTTGTDGRFRVSGLAEGRYRVVAAKTGWSTREVAAVEARERGAAPIEIVLVPQSGNLAPVGARDTRARDVRGGNSVEESVQVLAPALRDDFELQTWLNEQTTNRNELVAIVGDGGNPFFVVRPARVGEGHGYTVLAVSDALDRERLEARIVQQKGKTFVGLVTLAPERHALVFRNGS